MSKRTKTILVLITIGVLATFGLASTGKCAYCPGFTCFNSASCGDGCICITGPGESGGNCYGVR